MRLDTDFRFRCTWEFKRRFDAIAKSKGRPWDRSKLAFDVLSKYCDQEEKALGISSPKIGPSRPAAIARKLRERAKAKPGQ